MRHVTVKGIMSHLLPATLRVVKNISHGCYFTGKVLEGIPICRMPKQYIFRLYTRKLTLLC